MDKTKEIVELGENLSKLKKMKRTASVKKEISKIQNRLSYLKPKPKEEEIKPPKKEPSDKSEEIIETPKEEEEEKVIEEIKPVIQEPKVEKNTEVKTESKKEETADEIEIIVEIDKKYKFINPEGIKNVVNVNFRTKKQLPLRYGQEVTLTDEEYLQFTQWFVLTKWIMIQPFISTHTIKPS